MRLALPFDPVQRRAYSNDRVIGLPKPADVRLIVRNHNHTPDQQQRVGNDPSLQ
jgi:hypothetical protein